jgi:RNA polymerase sigma-54 factor
MALTQRLQMRQSQALVMTPQLMQAIKLLQLSNLELAAHIEAELEKNPLLERVDDDAPIDGNTEPASTDFETDAVTLQGGTSPIDDQLETSRDAIEQRLGTDLENEFPDEPGAARSDTNGNGPVPASDWTTPGGLHDDSEHNLEAYVSSEQTLADHLAQQLSIAIADPARRMIGQFLIDMVDESGYLTGDLSTAADKIGAPAAEIEAVLSILQTFDPPGVCARNLSECLSIQLREHNRLDPAMQALVGNLGLVAKRDFTALRRICGVDDEDLDDMIAELRKLNPKPGLAFGSSPIQTVVPDVFVRQTPDGHYAVELNSDTLPKVLINQRYHAELVKNAQNENAKTFLAENLQSATWLTRALDQRAKTILKVSMEIVKQQDAFFAHGVQHLRPLNLKMVADAIGMHESTVSRVTANKYMATSRGIFELKYFFTSAIAAADGGEAHSAEAVRHRIKQLIDAEAADDVLSDDTIVDRLRTAGIDIARRTVAKYRESMRIPSSVQRRREKLAGMG